MPREPPFSDRASMGARKPACAVGFRPWTLGCMFRIRVKSMSFLAREAMVCPICVASGLSVLIEIILPNLTEDLHVLFAKAPVRL